MASTTKTLFIFTRIFSSIFIGIAFFLSGLSQLDAQLSTKSGLSKEKQKTLFEKTASPDATQVAQAIALSLAGGGDRSLKPQVHSDAYSRFMYTHFKADYGLAGDTIVVDSTIVKPVEPARPRVALFFVPANKVPRDIAKAHPYTTVLEFVIKNAVDVQGTKKTDRTVKDYYVFAFFMERLAPDAKVGLLISDRPDGLSGHWKGITRFQQDGWHGAFIPATFAVDNSPERFFKVLFEPGSYTPEKQRQPKVVGVFTTASTVTLIQRALARRGYDPGPADGLMGMRTRRAIRKFQQDQGLKVDGEPSVALLAVITGAGQLPAGTNIEVLSATSKKSAAPSTSVRNRLEPKMWPNKIQRP
jgi:hypothetical protein